MREQFLPISLEEYRQRGIDRPDFVYVIGDAYVDHSSFGPAIISRVLESRGYSVGIIAQPDWTREESIQVFGEPKLGFLVSAGNMDSMVNHYTVSKKHRQKDSFSPGGRMGLRPDRAAIVYGNLIRKSYKKTPVILGGIEASLRRLGHYDYWSDRKRWIIFLLPSCFRLFRKSVRIRWNMPEVLLCSIRIRTRIRREPWQRITERRDMWCRIRRRTL